MELYKNSIVDLDLTYEHSIDRHKILSIVDSPYDAFLRLEGQEKWAVSPVTLIPREHSSINKYESGEIHLQSDFRRFSLAINAPTIKNIVRANQIPISGLDTLNLISNSVISSGNQHWHFKKSNLRATFFPKPTFRIRDHRQLSSAKSSESIDSQFGIYNYSPAQSCTVLRSPWKQLDGLQSGGTEGDCQNFWLFGQFHFWIGIQIKLWSSLK